ncbi:DUF6090 family protein [Ichthyenterobacterium sp. W332]|uniref:DUF6090 family protein n=1 Tax=Microcosmobacter mediterraneus TaxID=3075607 RepID=A0ABU2YJK4_9FLAO|nr:DUF6090 family protein [Ichthyenterobacterium sp. W332]MDT0558336.1 DUF6090 family protein [Ichthyenterobacterium sp. W332]
MIKFFRKIRYNLMETGKTTKYFKYAIGEIILVMIGILLALQVNNWNNQRLEVNKEQTILKNLRSDFRDNLTEFNRIYNSSADSYKSSIKLLEIIKNDNTINPAEAEILLDDIINGFYSLDLNSASIDEIKSSGSLSIIKDPELRRQLSNWSFIEADTEDDIEIYYNYMFDFLIPSLTNKAILRNIAIPDRLMEKTNLPKISSSSYTLNYSTTMRTLEFENQIYNNALNIVYVLTAYKNVEIYLNDTLKLIDANIK